MQSLSEISSKSDVPSQSSKKTYEMPQLHHWGNIEVLTQVGRTTVGTDVWPAGQEFPPGSVNPPGH